MANFTNIVATINRNKLWNFPDDPELVPSTARYFLRKKYWNTRLNSKGEKYYLYSSLVYSIGTYKENIWKGGQRPTSFPRCYSSDFEQWRASFETKELLNEEVIEIISS